MRDAIFNVRMYLRYMEIENDRLRRAAEKWSKL